MLTPRLLDPFMRSHHANIEHQGYDPSVGFYGGYYPPPQMPPPADANGTGWVAGQYYGASRNGPHNPYAGVPPQGYSYDGY